MSEKIRVDLNRGKCAKVKAAGAPQHWRRPQMDPFHNCRTPDPAVRESGLNDVGTFCYRRQGLRQPINCSQTPTRLSCITSQKDCQALKGRFRCKRSTHMSVWVACESRQEKEWRLEPLSPSLPPSPSTPPCPTAVKTLFQRIPFSRPHSPEDPGGAGSHRERQRVREEDQHRHREDLHPSRVQLLCRWCQRPRCLPGEIITHLTFDQISSLDIFQNL